MKKLVSAAVATIMTVAVLAAPSAAAAPAPVRSAIQWGPCASRTLTQAGAQCAMVSVPLDYRHPDGARIKLAVSRVKHTVPDSKYQGVMLVNPGGPGSPGLELSVLGQYVPNGAGAAYDWIGFDPRGVGSSVPALTCDPDYFGFDRPYYVPIGPRLEWTWRTRAAGYAHDCKRNGELLHHMRTTDSVQDMESLRTLLGANQLSYYGFSYGTYLGQVYATLHPDRVHRMVLDGNVDPKDVWYQANLNQDPAMERNIEIYFDWIAKHDAVYHLGTRGWQVEHRFYATQEKLIHHPAGGLVGPDELTEVFVAAAYYVFGWEDIAEAFSAYVNHGDWKPLRDLYAGVNPQGEDNSYAVYSATQCSDAPWPTNWHRWRLDNWWTFFHAPFETWGNAWYNAPCASWPVRPGEPVRVDGSKAPGILLISETFDAATPFAGSLEVRTLFPKSTLVEGVDGTTHAGSLFGDACVDNAIADYLATGAQPDRQRGRGSDKKCAPLRQPDPTALTPRSANGTPVMSPQLRKQLFGMGGHP
ncbi:alpha/beta hydrolase [Labedaea rhizosphaerae]|uniref:alpha/beta hydrolase n=1 Tax=Labedaea rhizosphaerae TaxID=598644 RepID=UPI0014150182|nr:alpha/beta hydrolase [Labedaea rhizosphaerae]